jgi:hypothetical protein
MDDFHVVHRPHTSNDSFPMSNVGCTDRYVASNHIPLDVDYIDGANQTVNLANGRSDPA